MDDFVFCGGAITFFMLLFGLVIALRYMNYRETLALAEKGLVKPDKRNGKGPLVWGILITAVGLALCIGVLPIGFWFNNNARLGPIGIMGPWLLVGLLPMFFGIGLILIYVLTRETPPKEDARLAASTALPAPIPPATPATGDAARVEKPPSTDGY
jgi:hypothetical protein